MSFDYVQSGDAAKAVFSQSAEMHRDFEGQQGLIRTNMAGGFVPSDVLFPVFLDEGEGGLPFEILADPDDSSRQVLFQFHAGGDHSQIRSAGVELESERLGFATYDIEPFIARARKTTGEHRIAGDDGNGAGFVSELVNFRESFHDAITIGRLHDQAGKRLLFEEGARRLGVYLAAVGIRRQVNDFDVAAFKVGREHLTVLGPEILRHQQLVATGRPASHPGRFGQGRRAVVNRTIDRGLP